MPIFYCCCLHTQRSKVVQPRSLAWPLSWEASLQGVFKPSPTQRPQASQGSWDVSRQWELGAGLL